jgi:hypothetical protein
MCIVLDINCFPSVFKEDTENHQEFKPVKNWIIEGKGKIVYGGTKYFEELAKLPQYVRFINSLKRAGKVVTIDDKKVDNKQQELSRFENKDFDDPHIVAILIVSGCCLVCSSDRRAYPFFKNNEWYPKGRNIPKIYSGSQNQDLLCDRNIAELCQPTQKLPKRDRQQLNF